MASSRSDAPAIAIPANGYYGYQVSGTGYLNFTPNSSTALSRSFVPISPLSLSLSSAISSHPRNIVSRLPLHSTVGLDPTRRPAASASPTAAATAGQAGDDNIKEGDDTVNDGGQDGPDAVDDGHEAGAYGLEDGFDLWDLLGSW